MALIEAPKHGSPVEHARTDKHYYQCIIDGKPYAKKAPRRRRGGTFDFRTDVHPDTLEKVPRARGKARARRPPKSKVVVGGVDVSDAESSETATSDSDSDESSSSSPSSSSPQSESVSGSAPRSGSAAGSGPAGSEQTENPTKKAKTDTVASVLKKVSAARVEPATATSSGGHSGGGCGGLIKLHNQTWYGARFTFTFPKKFSGTDDLSLATGLEVSCVCAAHGKCRKRLHFARYGGRETVERLLKWWVIGYEHETVINQKTHLHYLDDVEVEELPTLENMDILGDAMTN